MNSGWIDDKERESLVQFSTLMPEKRIDQTISSLTHSDRLSKNNFGYQMIEQLGAVYLQYSVDIHQKHLIITSSIHSVQHKDIPCTLSKVEQG